MANTLTGLIPTIYTALETVNRELIGFIPNVATDATAENAAVGQTVRSPIAGTSSLEDITPGNDPADSGDTTDEYVDVTITKSKAYPIRWTGEEQKSTNNYGIYDTLMAQKMEQGFRTIANAVEADLAALYYGASRAYGTAGTTPFGTANDHTDFAQANRILDENGCPASDRVMILGSAARANLEGKHPELFRVNEAGDAGAMLRNRQMRQLHNFTMGYSAGIKSHTKGTGSGYLLNDASSAAGDTLIAVDTGTGTVLTGDVVTLDGDANKYVVGTALSGGDLSINKPGLLSAAADNASITVGNSYTANMFYHRNAMLLAARQPAMPEGGDEADDVMTLTDPVSGLTYQFAMYRQYRRVKIEIGLAWGVKEIKPENMGILLG